MTKYFFELTKRNWGAAYHFIISTWIMLSLITLGLANHFSAVITFLILVGFEYWQLRYDRKPEGAIKDALEDMAFGVAGIVTMWLI